MRLDPSAAEHVCAAVNPERLLATAMALVEVPSPTRSAAAVADRLAALLEADSFIVERPIAGWPESPAVVARLTSGRPGRTLQFTGHLDTVHLPFVPPRFQSGVLYGSGSADMKGGIAAEVEALRVLRDTGLLTSGAVLLTAYDHHEGPWGDSRQLHALIDAGIHGDGALVAEYLADRLPLAGRGLAIFKTRFFREGGPVHEVFRPAGQADVLAAACEFVRRLRARGTELAAAPHPIAGAASTFVGRVAGGEIYNQSPVECVVEGTRRWLPGESAAAAREEFDALAHAVAAEYGAGVDPGFGIQRDAFELAADDPLVDSFRAAYAQVTGGSGLPVGAKPFVDDGNTLSGRAGIPVVTHGPNARGAHTLEEWVPLDELVRVARVYALTALAFTAG